MRFLMVLCLLLMGASAFAEDEAMRDIKTANPFILLHPESQQACCDSGCSKINGLAVLISRIASSSANADAPINNRHSTIKNLIGLLLKGITGIDHAPLGA